MEIDIFGRTKGVKTREQIIENFFENATSIRLYYTEINA
jgi:hypothetical protein